ncbi:MAG: hypothetical protein QW057_04025 [Candidatus Bathyarchaeia archaeon]
MIGSYAYRQTESHPELGLEAVFVHDADPKCLAGLPRELILERVEDFTSQKPHMVAS